MCFSGCSLGLLISSQLRAPSKTLGFTPELRSKAPPELASHPPLHPTLLCPPPAGWVCTSGLLTPASLLHQPPRGVGKSHAPCVPPCGPVQKGPSCWESRKMSAACPSQEAGEGGGGTSISFNPDVDRPELIQAWPLQGLENPLYFCLLAPGSGLSHAALFL